VLLDDDALHYILFYPMKKRKKRERERERERERTKNREKRNLTRLASELAPAQLSHPSR
jgi:nitrate reductase assembly molybdenum cofactor insertion protein NarJ